MKGLVKRVRAIERPQPVGCDTCRFWTWMIVVTIDAGGNETGRSRPDGCSACGRDVAVEHVVELVGVPWDVV
jgi:hypothetical protein